MADHRKRLDALRNQIDRIDDQLHDLLMERAEIGEKIGDVKGHSGLAVRPAREARILQRLLDRHAGRLPKADLVHIWQEIFGSSIRMQGPFSVAALSTENCRALARDQFGARTAIICYESPRRVIEAVSKGEVSVGVLPPPGHSDVEPWWWLLVSDAADALKIVARLPIAGNKDAPRLGEGMVVANLSNEPSGRDRSFVVIDAESKFSSARLGEILRDVGLDSSSVTLWHKEQPPENWYHLLEVDRYLSPADKILIDLGKALGASFRRLIVIGGYATPFSVEELS